MRKRAFVNIDFCGEKIQYEKVKLKNNEVKGERDEKMWEGRSVLKMVMG